MRVPRMPLLLTVLALSAIFRTMGTGAAATAADDSGIATDFEAALDLWRDGRYGELFDRTYAAGTGSREAFILRMAGSSRKPACCWQKLQELKISGINGNRANLSARVGLEGMSGETEYCTRSFRLKKDEGTWKIPLADILSLAGKSARRRIRGR